MNQEKSRLADLSQYNNENNIEKLIAKIEKNENESNEILIDNLIKAQDEVDFMAEETTKILNLQIEEKLLSHAMILTNIKIPEPVNTVIAAILLHFYGWVFQ